MSEAPKIEGLPGSEMELPVKNHSHKYINIITAFIKESPRLLNTGKNICIGTMDPYSVQWRYTS